MHDWNVPQFDGPKPVTCGLGDVYERMSSSCKNCKISVIVDRTGGLPAEWGGDYFSIVYYVFRTNIYDEFVPETCSEVRMKFLLR